MNERYMHLLSYFDLDKKLIEIERSKAVLKGIRVSEDTARTSDRLQRVK